MPSTKLVIESTFTPSFRTERIAGMFDVPVEKKLSKSWDVDLPIEDFDWQVGLIVGPSGSGKSTIARNVFGDNFHAGFSWNRDRALVDDFAAGLPVGDIVDALSHVGLSSPPAWLQPFHTLSNGQQFRADVARAILEAKGTVVIDEFTSVVDREVAKMSSFAVQKYIRKTNKRFVAVSCHYDISEWLQPDWIYQVDSNTFTRGSLRRPEIKLEIFQCHHKAWKLFEGHHYLDRTINKAANCFIGLVNGQPAVFTAALPFPQAQVKNIWREHRTVALPDYQGVGLGNRMSDAIADHFLSMGKRYRSTTSHPAMIFRRSRPGSRWVMDRAPGQVAALGKSGVMGNSSAGRVTASFEYIGDGVGYKIESFIPKKPSKKRGRTAAEPSGSEQS